MTEINGKTTVITGAGSGIGRGCALGFAAAGSRVAITDINSEALTRTASLIRDTGGEVLARQVDVANRDAVYDFAAEVQDEWGGADIVLNNAGVAQVSDVASLTYDDFQWVMDIDFWGMVHGAKAFLPQLQMRGAGHVANVSSVFGIIGFPRQAAYNAAKFGIRGFTEALAHEMKGSEIRVSCIYPGGIQTNIIHHARLPQEETAELTREEMAAQFESRANTTPEQAAQVIIRGIRKNKARILIGRDARMISLIQRLFPATYMSVLTKLPGWGQIGAQQEN